MKTTLLLLVLPFIASAQKFNAGISAGINNLFDVSKFRYGSFTAANSPRFGPMYGAYFSLQPGHIKYTIAIDAMHTGNPVYGNPAFLPNLKINYVARIHRNNSVEFGTLLGTYRSFIEQYDSYTKFRQTYKDRGISIGANLAYNLKIHGPLHAKISSQFIYSTNKVFYNNYKNYTISSSVLNALPSQSSDYNQQMYFYTVSGGFYYEFGQLKARTRNNQYRRSTTSLPISVAEELTKLKKLKDDGGLTEQEYEAQKKKLLNKY
jgi:hypothetical protein